MYNKYLNRSFSHKGLLQCPSHYLYLFVPMFVKLEQKMGIRTEMCFSVLMQFCSPGKANAYNDDAYLSLV